MDAKRLKDLENNKEADSKTTEVAFMVPRLLALASSGSFKKLKSLLNGEDIEAEESSTLLEGVTAEGDTALHVVATYGQGSTFLPMYEKRNNFIGSDNGEDLNAERDALNATYGDGKHFKSSARIIFDKAKHLLLKANNKGDTPLHCAARAGKAIMVNHLMSLCDDNGSMKKLLRRENKRGETVLHEAVRVGNNEIVEWLMDMDSELANFPVDSASPLYLAIVLKQDLIMETIYEKSDKKKLSYSGQNGQNALHAAVLRGKDITEKLLKWNNELTKQRDKNGSTPLHFAAAVTFGPAGKSVVCEKVLKANEDALYQPDHAGVFPIHVAASLGAHENVMWFVEKRPSSAGLRDAKGRTFLHVAVEKNKMSLVFLTCINWSTSWIMNMQDDDGNTALHLAVDAGSLRMFCYLLGNREVNLNLINNNGRTPLDIAQSKVPQGGLYSVQNSEVLILHELEFDGAVNGVCRRDHVDDDNNARRVKDDDGSKIIEVLKDSTQTMFIGSVLIASVTFGATFAVPGGYIADDHDNGGTPIFARRYAFDAFVVSNTVAFIFSVTATIALMVSGSPMHNRESRRTHFHIAAYLLALSVKSLAATFALGGYVVLAPVAHKTAVAICVLSCLVLLYDNLDFIWRRLLLLTPSFKRGAPIWALLLFTFCIVGNSLLLFWPLIFIFGWAANTRPAPNMVQAPSL